jgi:hypothetical protein
MIYALNVEEEGFIIKIFVKSVRKMNKLIDVIIDENLECLFVETVDSFKLKTGDISPMQTIRLENIKQNLKDLLKEFIKENGG